MSIIHTSLNFSLWNGNRRDEQEDMGSTEYCDNILMC